MAVEQTTLGRCFHAVPPEDREKFDRLAKVIGEQLWGVKVYKVGDKADRGQPHESVEDYPRAAFAAGADPR